MKEKWVRINTIGGYEEIRDCYYLSNSNEDKIMNKDTGKILKINLNNKGCYKRIRLMTKDGKVRNYYLHVLKVKAFIYGPNPLDATLVRHLDDCKTNNALINLSWGTVSDNVQDCIRNGNFSYFNGAKNGKINGAKTGAKNGKKGAKKLSKPVKCVEIGIIYPSTKEAERQLGINQASISACCNGKQQTAGGYHFEFVNKEVK